LNITPDPTWQQANYVRSQNNSEISAAKPLLTGFKSGVPGRQRHWRQAVPNFTNDRADKQMEA
jgi:hypothetical protein